MSAGKDRERSEPTIPDFDKLAQNSAQLVEEFGKVAAAYIRPREQGVTAVVPAEETSDVVKTLGRVAEHWISNPQRALEAQRELTTSMMTLWANTLRKMQGEPAPPVAEPEPRDRRFADQDWQDNPYFDFLKQAYLVTTRWADHLVEDSDGLDEHTRQKAQFYVRQLSSALSPSNFVATNPELLRTTLQEGGENLVRGMRMLAEDIAAGGGDVKIRQSDPSGFEVGRNMATTPGKVILRNTLIELLQYDPATPEVNRTPLLICPPWINKYYILDLNAEKSFVRWCVEQGQTVFVMSWVNPDARHAHYDFESYMREGVLAALDAVEAATDERRVNTIGYCVGGTLLAVTLAWLAAKNDDRVASATFLTTQVDFTHAGDLKVFVDEDQIRAAEEAMAKLGYLPGARMAGAFNMLRPLDLIWPYVVNTYLKGRQPIAFDLLTWNSDSTRMPEANHRFYLRNCYLENKLSRGEMEVGGVRLDLSLVHTPIYNLAAREDHIAPARSVFVGSGCFGGEVRYVLAGSGHIAGVVNPPAKQKYQYWTGGAPKGEFEDWLAQAEEHPGSWWTDWIRWIEARSPERVPARIPGAGKLPAIAEAPGDYVRIKA